MNQPRLGKLADGGEKDAIHIAIMPMTSDLVLQPGEHVGVEKEKGVETEKAVRADPIGIVDPFLSRAVDPGECFWLCLYPGSITSLRHDWTHPAFAANEDEAWIREFADVCGMSYNVMMNAADGYQEDGSYTFMGENQSYNSGHGQWGEFWTRWARVTGKESPKDEFSFFSCSC